MNKIIATILLSALPLTELRASIPIAIKSWGMDPILVFFLAILGNSLLILVILILDLATKLSAKYFPPLHKLIVWNLDRTQRKTKEKIEKYGALALIIFVAIPLPGTGALTASLAAWIFNIKFKKAFGPIFIGIIIAGLIVTALSVGLINLF